jgi:hypothetical protein
MLDKFADVRLEFCNVRRLQISAIRSQHCVKAVGSGENDLGDSLATLGYQGRRQQVLEFMRQFTKLPESTCRGIALERVHGATHASQGIGIARIALEKDSRFIQFLQQILRALKKEFAKFGGAFIGKKVQPATSMR